MSPADNLCTRSNLLDTLIVFLKDFFKKVDFELKKSADDKKHVKFPRSQREKEVISTSGSCCVYSVNAGYFFMLLLSSAEFFQK